MGCTIKEAFLYWERSLATPNSAEFAQNLAGQKIVSIHRRGKFLVFELSTTLLIVHLRMSGDLRVEKKWDGAAPALLPHDRTEMERTRERSDFAFLTTGSAWFPPTLAAVMLGLEFGFWQHATSFTGESLNILIFAVIIWLLLEFRLDERIGRLYLAALIYSAGLADNWALLGFLPVSVAAIIWLRGLAFFDLRFLFGMMLSALAGLLFFLVLPIVGKMSGDFSLSFWELLKPAWRLDWQVISAISNGDVRHNLLIMSVTTFLPVLVMSIRWNANFGDNSAIGTALANYMFHGVHAVIFTVCVWVMFDSPFSPSQLSLGMPALTMY